MRLLLAFIAVPLIEIALFIQVGGFIGLWPTLFIVLATAFAGSIMVRSQGAQTLVQLQNSFHDVQDPTEPLAHGAMILFAGALLLTPGFFTDAFGLALLIPKVRATLFNFMRQRMTTTGFQTHSTNPNPTTIDGEFVEVPPQDGPSGWTKD